MRTYRIKVTYMRDITVRNEEEAYEVAAVLHPPVSRWNRLHEERSVVVRDTTDDEPVEQEEGHGS